MRLWITLLLFVANVAQAQAIWRCGADGRSYADAPCRDGRVIEVAEGRPAADLSGAQDMARREKSLAAQLVRERQQRESQALAGPAGIGGSRMVSGTVAAAVKPKAKARATGKRQLEGADTWRAVAPASRRGKD